MTKPEVSVVMVTCNVERFLAESIESILGQTFQDFEFIIVDFGSTDNSKSIISGYAAKDDRIKLHSVPPCGLAEARNAASFLAQGRYLAIMDADDVSSPNRLESEVEFLEAHPEVGALGGAVQWINAAGRPLLTTRHPLTNSELQAAVLTHSILWQPTVMLRSEAFASVGGYRGAFAPAEDYDLWLRIAERFQLANLEPVVLKYRIHSSQVSLSKRTQQTLGILAAQKSALARRQGEPDPLESVQLITPGLLAELGITQGQLQRRLADDYFEWTFHMYRAGEYSGPLQALLEFLQTSLQDVEPERVADLYLMEAKFWWKMKRYFRSGVSTAHAVVTRPAMTKNLFQPLLRRLRLA